MRPLLFDRFESDRDPGIPGLLRDIADLLGARRSWSQPLPGILSWGLAGASGLNPESAVDREYLASQIVEALTRFEPRLAGINVIPVEDSKNFSFRLEATLLASEDESLTLRILAPRIGGGLGAEVLVLDG